MKIWYDTPIWELRDAGIMPEWLYRECDEHGMDCAEYVLCEHDWEWGGDLGKWMTSEQLEVVARVRKIISDSIAALENDEEFLAKLKREKEERDKRKELSEFCTRQLYPYFCSEERAPKSWIVDYLLEDGDIPLFHLLEKYMEKPKSDLLEATKMLAGVGRDEPMAFNDVVEALPTLKKYQIRKLKKGWPWPIKDYPGKLIMRIPEFLPKRPLAETDEFWQQMIAAQRVRCTPKQLMRMIALMSPVYEISEGMLIQLPS